MRKKIEKEFYQILGITRFFCLSDFTNIVPFPTDQEGSLRVEDQVSQRQDQQKCYRWWGKI